MSAQYRAWRRSRPAGVEPKLAGRAVKSKWIPVDATTGPAHATRIRPVATQAPASRGRFETVNQALDDRLPPSRGGARELTSARICRCVVRFQVSAPPYPKGASGLDGPFTDNFAYDQMTVGTMGELAPIPEPSTWVLMALGLLGVAGWARRHRA